MRHLSFLFLVACGAVTQTPAPTDPTDPTDPADPMDPADPEPEPECTPNVAACNGTAVDTCGPDGFVAASESCSLGCVAGDATHLAHCAHVVPEMLEGACDELAAEPSFASPTGKLTLDTNVDATCTGGIVAQLSGPEICVVRAGTIELRDVKVTGRRPIAFVADGALDVTGTLDVSADGAVSGPGGGIRISGQAMDQGGGGGGAGFRQSGGIGGGSGEFGTGAGTAGAVFDPLGQPFQGGARSAAFRGAFPPVTLGGFFPKSGGGGGALMLVACRGTVTVSGTIDAAGGGGTGGGDISTGSSTVTLYGGAAGGSGGYVVVQGAQVVVTGRMFAAGGGGGGGCATDNCIGIAGQDGLGPTTTGAGGSGSSGGANGGAGGTGTRAAANGTNSATTQSPGGGGGATGRFQVFVPAGMTPTLTASAAEPAFETTRTISTR